MAPDTRPKVDAGLLGAALERLPARLRRRLDAEPAIAESWTWNETAERVTVAHEDASVVLVPVDGVVSESAAATCSCLLAPACLHLAAVLLRLEPTIAVAPDRAVEDQAAPVEPDEPSAPSKQMEVAAREMAAAAARLLDVGATGAGLVASGEILRAVHSCQVTGLHRCAAAGLRVAQGLARLQNDEPEFRLRDLRNDVAEALRVSRRLLRGDASRAVVGTARRAYEPVGSLRLYGLFAEPVIARSGFAGCVTWLVDDDRRIWALSDVLPADAWRAVEAYGNGAGIGDVSLSHRELARAGMHLTDGRASADGRLGRGQQVRAVSASGVAWSESPIVDLFRDPVAAQLERIWRARDLPEGDRRDGGRFLFLEAAVVGARRGQLVLEVEGNELIAVAPADDPELAYRDNLEVLAAARRVRLLIVARPLVDQPGALELLAAGASDAAAGAGLVLPEAWAGRANLGFDRLTRAAAQPTAAPAPATAQRPRTPDVVDPLTRRLDRMVLGGRLTMGAAAQSGVDRDVALLRRRHLQTGAAVLRDLATTAAARTTAEALAERWLAAVVYERRTSQRVAMARWLSG